MAPRATVLDEADLPMVGFTPFSRPEGLDASLAALGYHLLDATGVMAAIHRAARPEPLPAGWRIDRRGHAALAERLRVFRSCPLILPKAVRSSLQMLAIARAMSVLCA